jgi:hypothetical protein
MPRYDRTGPMGTGPGTGRGLGNCFQGQNLSTSQGFGGATGMFRGNQAGMGIGNRCRGPRGWFRNLFQQPTAPTEEADSLRAALAAAKDEIAAMEARLAELERKG